MRFITESSQKITLFFVVRWLAIFMVSSAPLPGMAQGETAPSVTAADHAAQARAALAKEDVSGAVGHYEQALALTPDSPDILHNLAFLSQRTGDAANAAKYFKQAVALAVSDGRHADVRLYNDQLPALLARWPAGAERRMAGALAVPADKQRILAIWGRMRADAADLAGQDRIDEALALGQRALDTARDNLGADHAAVLPSLRDLAAFHRRNNAPGAATAALDEAAALAERILGRSHPETLDIRMERAGLHEQALELEQARAAFEESRAAALATLGPDHPATLTAALAVARLDGKTGAAEIAEGVLRDLCPRFSRVFGPHHPERAACLGEQVERLNGLGRFAEAERPLREHLAITTANQGADHPDALANRVALGTLYRRLGRLAEAETLFAETLERYRAVLGPYHPGTIVATNNLGLVLEKMGLYDRAEPLLRDAVRDGAEHLGEGDTTTLAAMNNLALLHESQGRFDDARRLYRQAIAILEARLGKDHPDTLARVNNLAFVHLLDRAFDQAAPLFETVLSVWRQRLGPQHQDTLKALNNLARTRMGQGRLDDAEALFTEALTGRRESLGDTHMDTLRSRHDLARLLAEKGDAEQAARLLEALLPAQERSLGAQHPYTFESLNALAATLERQDRTEEAFRWRKTGFERRNRFFDRMLWVTGDNAREGYIQLHKPEQDAYLDLLSRIPPERAGAEVLAVAMRRKGLLLAIAAQTQQVVRMSGDPALKALGEALEETRRQLAALTLSGPVNESDEAHLRRLHALEAKVGDLQAALGRASARFARAITPGSVDALAASLPEGAALVDFVIHRDGGGQERLLAGLAGRRDGTPWFSLVDFGLLAPIQEMVLAYRKAIQDEDLETSEIRAAGLEGVQRIWQPLAPLIGDARTVYLVPDGILNIFPFAALPDGEGDGWLLERIDLRILTSSRDLLGEPLAPARGGLYSLAAPDYDLDEEESQSQRNRLRARRAGQSGQAETVPADGDATTRGGSDAARSAVLRQGLRMIARGMRGLRFDPLPGTLKEGLMITRQARKRGIPNRLAIKFAAQEKTLASLAAPPEILHIATHGFFLKADDDLKQRLLKFRRGADMAVPPPGDNPLLRSGLAFAGINNNAPFLGEIDTGNDGVLTALEILGLDLSGTRLSVLSACETGLGEIHEGEGVYGLRRAFQEAGSQAVITSLWEVSDAGTQALMSALYDRMLGGATPHQALRAAQLALMKSPAWESPYIWAAFMMVGRE